MSHERGFRPISLDESDAMNSGGWNGVSSALFLVVAGGYTVATWLVAGLPPLLFLVTRSLTRHRAYQHLKSSTGGSRTHEYR